MVHFYFIGFIVIFAVVPQSVHSLFIDSMENIITVTGNLSCQSEFAPDREDFQLCAIFVYTVNNTDPSQDMSLHDGMAFTNTFRQFIQTRNCTGFTNTSDVGSGTCDLMPYESAQNMTLCICAANRCNKDLSTCLDSLNRGETVPLLPIILPNLTVNIICYNPSVDDSDCSLAPTVINVTACNDYIRDHSVLCAIATPFGTPPYRALIKENYQRFLDGKLRDLKSLASSVKLFQTATNIYAQYTIADGKTNEECGCTQSSLCNYNISTCSANAAETETSNPSTSVTNSMSESITLTTAVTMESITSIMTTISSTSSTPLVTSLSDITTAATYTSTASNNVFSYGLSAANMTTNFNTESTASTTQSSTAVNSASTTHSPTTVNTASTAQLSTMSTASVTYSNAESGAGLSRGAVIGIIVGAVLGGLLVISAIFFVCVTGKLCSPFDRSYAYEI